MLKIFPGNTAVVVLDTDDLALLLLGKPLVIEHPSGAAVRKFLLMHCADTERLEKEFGDAGSMSYPDFRKLLDEARSWPEVKR